jgi:O-antigen/teichoic acid export membrane protein
MATLVTGMVALVADLGIGTAMVARRVADVVTLRQLNSVALLGGLWSFLFVAWGSTALARFFRADQLVSVVTVLSATIVVQSAKTVSEGLLLQERRFRLLAGVQGASSVSGALLTVACALLGWGYWSLVLGSVATAVLGAGALVMLRPVAFAMPTRHVLGTLRVSFDILGSRLAWYSYSNADFLVAGRVLGPTPLGAYTMAWTIATAPVDKIAATLNQVSQPFFAANRDDRDALRKQFLTITQGIALVTIPACVGLALVAEDLVEALLGPTWSEAVLPLQILCLYTPLRCLAVVVTPLLLALGESRHVLVCTIAAAVALPFCFLLGSRLGPAGIAGAWVVAYPLVAAPLYARSLPKITVTMMDYLRSLYVPLSTTLVMGLVAALLGRVLSTQWHPGYRLAVQVAIGAGTWLGALLVLSPPTARRILDLARELAARTRSTVG